MNQDEALKKSVERFYTTLKGRWQLFFLPAAVLFAVSLAHRLFARPEVNRELLPYLSNIDRVSFVVAAVLAVVILNLKRRYFSPRFTRDLMTGHLKTHPETENKAMLKIIFAVWLKKLTLVWGLGLLLVLDGVLYYWLTFSPDNNLFIYFVIGAFSLFLNYPRRDWFAELGWQIAEVRRDYPPANAD